MTEPHTLPNILRFHARRTPDKPAFIFRAPDSRARHVLTYGDLYDLAGRMAHVLHERGLMPGNIIINSLPNSPECAILETAVLLCGAASLEAWCCSKDGSDIVARLKISRAASLFVDPDFMGSTWPALAAHLSLIGDDGAVTSNELPDLRYVFLVYRRSQCQDGNMTEDKQVKTTCGSWGDQAVPRDFLTTVGSLPPNKHYHADVSEDDICHMFSTSGTTAAPKMGIWTQKAYVSMWRAYYRTGQAEEEIEFKSSPLMWVSAYVSDSIMPGCTRVLCDTRAGKPRDMGAFIYNSIVEEGVIGSSIQVPYLQAVVDHFVAVGRQEPILEKLRVDSQPITRQIVQLASVLTRKVVVDYALSELNFVSGTVLACGSMHMGVKDHFDLSSFKDYFAGRVIPGVEVSIRDETGREVGVGVRGEVHVKTPFAFSGYLDAPDVTAACYTHDGYFRTGDVGWLEEAGCLYTEGRCVDCFNFQCFQVYPADVEDVLRMCPGVEDVMVVGVPHPILHNEICACVVTKSPDVTMKDVRQFFEDQIAEFVDPLEFHTIAYYLHFESFSLTAKYEKYDRKATRKRATEMLGKLPAVKSDSTENRP